MSKFKQVNEEIEMVSSLKFIAQAFEEISVMRMQKVRPSVVQARDFVSQLATVFTDVQISYKDTITHISKAQKEEAAKQNKKPLVVLISSNAKLYGSIVRVVFNKFLEASKTQDVDLLIIGKVGKDLYEEQEIKKHYAYYDLPDKNVSLYELKNIIFYLLNYDIITVFHAQFNSVLSQIVTSAHLTGDQPFQEIATTEQKGDSVKHDRFIFEPSLEEIMQFFKTQVFIALFKQTVHESKLAHYASRIKTMEEALQHIETRSKILYSEKKKAHKYIENKKALEQIAGRSIWFRR